MIALPFLLGVLGMTAIVAGRYLGVSGMFAWLTARRGIVAGPADAGKRRIQIRREIGWSLVSAAIYALPAGLVAVAWREHGWTLIYDNPTTLGWLWLPFSIAIYLFAHDTWFYWTHRLMHRPWWFKRVHAVHHDSRPPTAWAAMAFHPYEALSGAFVFPVLVFLVPIHWAALMVVLLVATFFGVTNHMGWEIFPRRLVDGNFGRCMITASHHHLHHRHYRCNYGLYFRVWDRLCGTDRGYAGELLHELSGPEPVVAAGVASHLAGHRARA
ncbi:sterol desaturase family protein [Glacieibacterium sp.]|uniref:sterol desaturase family protein n=1 Tax=Glacieibacterium sp. TaxID=2860237 RepID=UPI003B00712B